MSEDRGAQAVHHALADRRREPGLHDAQQLGRDGHREHASDGDEQEADVLIRDGHVDGLAHEEGLGHRDDRGRDDEGDDDRHGESVVGEECGHPTDRDRRLGELGAVAGVDALG